MKKIRDITPRAFQCWPLPACPSVFVTDSSYVFIGKKVDADSLGISERVGDDELVIELPKELVNKAIVGHQE